MTGFISEIQRRGVVRIGAAYAVTAWLVAQITSFLVSTFAAPQWITQAIVVLLAIGLVPALVLAWVYGNETDTGTLQRRRRVGAWTMATAVAVALLLIFDLAGGRKWLVPGSELRPTAVAVLPFDNLSGNPEQDYFVSGMRDALIGALGEVGSVKLVWISQADLARAGKSAPEIGRQLGVDGVVTGAAMRAGDEVRLQVRLVRVQPEERLLWSKSYDRSLPEVLALQQQVAIAIAGAMKAPVTEEQRSRLADADAVDPVAYEAYLRGMHHLAKGTDADVATGLRFLQEAVDRDPGSPQAFAGLAIGYATVGHGPGSPPEVWAKARAAALRALGLDPDLAEAHFALADVKLYFENDWEGAEQEFRRANQLNPSLAMNHYHYAWYLVLMGRLDDAIVEHKLAQALDPLNPLHTAWLGGLYVIGGEYDKAIAEARKCFDMDDQYAFALLNTGRAYYFKGMHGQAIEALRGATRVIPDWGYWLAVAYVRAGQRDEAVKMLADLESQPPTPFGAYGLALVHAALGNNDAAFRWLEFQPRHAWVPWVRVEAEFAELRKDPRFQDFLRQFKLPQCNGDSCARSNESGQGPSPATQARTST
jgi:TolB-like protein/tetratricopeptide (TPR) repeat protein